MNEAAIRGMRMAAATSDWEFWGDHHIAERLGNEGGAIELSGEDRARSAEAIGVDEPWEPTEDYSSLHYRREVLAIEPDGGFILIGSGGAATPWARRSEEGGSRHTAWGEGVIKISGAEAFAWLVLHNTEGAKQ